MARLSGLCVVVYETSTSELAAATNVLCYLVADENVAGRDRTDEQQRPKSETPQTDIGMSDLRFVCVFVGRFSSYTSRLQYCEIHYCASL